MNLLVSSECFQQTAMVVIRRLERLFSRLSSIHEICSEDDTLSMTCS